MCGIAGFISCGEGAQAAAVIERMTNIIRHRGPDGAGIHADPPAWLGHRRLSIIDVAGGQQPMPNEDRSAWIVFNGEIFNHADLRPYLERSGHRYQTRCDTETILHAYEEYGIECVTRFRGMFAFAIWNRKARTLFCARDRLGIKPFYYYWDGRLFAFASEIKALLEHPKIPAAFEAESLPEYLALGFTSDEKTLFRGIRKLMPGHCLTLCPDAATPLRITRYWEIPHSEEGASRSEEDWIRECRHRLEETVRMRLMSDVPLGMFLSGGVDSSAIAALMSRMVEEPVKTFSVGYSERQFSELDYARQVAEVLGTDHHEVRIGREDFFQALPRLIWHEDEPIVWPSSVALYFVSRLASDYVKVVLTGEGSDELFAGYSRYRFYLLNLRYLRAYQLLPKALRSAVRDFISESPLLTAAVRRKLRHTALGLGESLEALYIDNFYSAFSGAQQTRMGITGDPYAAWKAFWNNASSMSPLARMLYVDQKTYMVELLMKQDQMSMACSIESRVPFLDHPFVEFASRVPEKLKLHHGDGKHIVKRSVEDLLPREIVYRTKMGFPTPLRAWLAGPESRHITDMLLEPNGLIASEFDAGEVRRLVDSHQSGREDATDRIWRLLNLQIWGEIFLGARPTVEWSGWFRETAGAPLR